MKKKLLFFAAFALFCLAAESQTAHKPAAKPVAAAKKTERLVQITTNYGVMVVKLYDSTPLHRDNFIKLVKQGFYDSLLFHRVIKSFMIQGGDPTSKNAAAGTLLGEEEGPGGRIPAEIKPYLLHKKGALAMARDDNPEKASSNCQFYIVQGQPFTDSLINSMLCSRIWAANPSFVYADAQRQLYKTLGGTPFLDQSYTVFGEVIKGLEVLDKIAAAPCDDNNRPHENVWMKMKLLN